MPEHSAPTEARNARPCTKLAIESTHLMSAEFFGALPWSLLVRNASAAGPLCAAASVQVYRTTRDVAQRMLRASSPTATLS